MLRKSNSPTEGGGGLKDGGLRCQTRKSKVLKLFAQLSNLGGNGFQMNAQVARFFLVQHTKTDKKYSK
jgi:hypothetical protein